jgi:cyclase
MGNLNITFSQGIALHLAGVAVRLVFAAHNGKAHSRGDAIVILEQDRILFAGDLLYTDFHPVTIYGDIPNWIQSINHLIEQDFSCVVPGHGPVSINDNKVYKEALAKFQSYLEDFYERLKEVKSGKMNPGQLETYMKTGNYAAMGKTWMVKRNIDHFLRG